MRTQTMRVNQLSDKAFEWYRSYLDALDAKDIEAYGEFLADDVTVQMNNDEPMQGKEAVLRGLGEYWQSFGALEHELQNIYGTDESFVLEALNHYERSDGVPVTLRAAAFTDRDEDGKAISVRFYTDTAPLF